MRLLILDNYDSFTWNLFHYVQQLASCPVEVHRNDALALDEVDKFSHIILSPGPGLPHEAGIMNELIKLYSPAKPILGICLGHQAIAEVFGGRLRNLKEPLHGVAEPVVVTEPDVLFVGLPSVFDAGRYHSWVVDEQTLPSCLSVTAVDAAGRIMALRHVQYDVRGVQFHPESVMTPFGLQMLSNWIARYLDRREPEQRAEKVLR